MCIYICTYVHTGSKCIVQNLMRKNRSTKLCGTNQLKITVLHWLIAMAAINFKVWQLIIKTLYQNYV